MLCILSITSLGHTSLPLECPDKYCGLSASEQLSGNLYHRCFNPCHWQSDRRWMIHKTQSSLKPCIPQTNQPAAVFASATLFQRSCLASLACFCVSSLTYFKTRMSSKTGTVACPPWSQNTPDWQTKI